MRGDTSRRRVSRHWQAAAVVAAIGMTLAACGGGSKKPSASKTSETTDTTAVTASTDSTLPGETTTTGPGAVTGATTATTIRTTTTIKSSASKKTTNTTTPKSVQNVAGGITNVTAATTTPPKNVTPGGTVTFLKAGEITGFDPVVITNSGASDGPPADLVYDMLMYSDPKSGGIVPQTAESLTSSDGLTWTLKLRPNIKFSDGTPYDADAVKFNWQRLQDPTNKANRAAQANLMASMDVLDAQTLKITLKNKNGVFPVAVTLIPFIASPTAIKNNGATSLMTNPVGAGPFTLKSWTRDSQMVFVRNSSYWNAPQPYLDQVVLKPIVDETQRMNTYVSGQANMVYIGAAQNADQINRQNAGTQYPMILNGGINIYFNTKKLPFSDVRARQALASAIDPVDYVKVVTSGVEEPIDSIFRHDSPFYDPAITQPKYDPQKTQQLLDAFAADHGPLNFTMTAFPSQNYAVAVQYFQGKLNSYKNVHMDIQTEASSAHITACTSGNFDSACEFGNIFDDPEPTWTGLYGCNSAPSPTGWCNAQFDKDVTDNQTTLNAQQRINDIKDAQKVFYSEVPSLYIERRYSWDFAASNVQDFVYANDGLPLIPLMWIKK